MRFPAVSYCAGQGATEFGRATRGQTLPHNFYSTSYYSAEGENRTLTGCKPNRILNPARLPVPPLRRYQSRGEIIKDRPASVNTQFQARRRLSPTCACRFSGEAPCSVGRGNPLWLPCLYRNPGRHRGLPLRPSHRSKMKWESIPFESRMSRRRLSRAHARTISHSLARRRIADQRLPWKAGISSALSTHITKKGLASACRFLT